MTVPPALPGRVAGWRGAALLAALVGLLVAAVPAAAVPPPNDDYLASWDMQGPHGRAARSYRAPPLDTTDASVQPDLFDPDRDGFPLGSGDGAPVAEPSRCGGVEFGKTVWFDVRPEYPGVFKVQADGFDSVIALYTWSTRTSKLGRMLTCTASVTAASSELMFTRVRAGAAYTVQVGGRVTAGIAASGRLDFRFDYLPDRDGDGVFDDLPDACKTLPGIERNGGCPPMLPRAGASWTTVGGLTRFTEVAVEPAPRGTRLTVSCRRCGLGRSVVTARRKGRLVVRPFRGRPLPVGATVEVVVAKRRDRDGDFRFGAVGRRTLWTIGPDILGSRRDRCLHPRTGKTFRCPG